MPAANSTPPAIVTLSETVPADLDLFYRWQLDRVAAWMAAFTADDPGDRTAFDARWQRILSNPAIIKRTILAEGLPVGSMMAFELFGQPSVGYWIDRDYWGRGIASRALAAFLELVFIRPLYARVAEDNLASQRVLQKSGFKVCGQERAFANARQALITELILRLDAGLTGNPSDRAS